MGAGSGDTHPRAAHGVAQGAQGVRAALILHQVVLLQPAESYYQVGPLTYGGRRSFFVAALPNALLPAVLGCHALQFLKPTSQRDGTGGGGILSRGGVFNCRRLNY